MNSAWNGDGKVFRAGKIWGHPWGWAQLSAREQEAEGQPAEHVICKLRMLRIHGVLRLWKRYTGARLVKTLNAAQGILIPLEEKNGSLQRASHNLYEEQLTK